MERTEIEDADGTGGRGESVPVTDFDRLCDLLAAWCAPSGEFRRERAGGGEDDAAAGDTSGDRDCERAVCDFGTATLVVTSEGRVEGGMPLHGFEGRAERLVVGEDTVRVLGPDVEYVYRRP